MEVEVPAQVTKHPWALFGHWQDPEVLELIKKYQGDREFFDHDGDVEESEG